MNSKKALCMLLVFVILLSLLSGCGKTVKTVLYDMDTPAISVPSGSITSNANFELFWDDDSKCVLLQSISTGKIWSNIPYDYYMQGGVSTSLNSPINISIMDDQYSQTNINGYTGAVMSGRVFSEKINSGIRVTYCFDACQISIPVEYVLRTDSLMVKIDTPAIVEGSKNMLMSVSLAPFLCSTPNDADDAYLFVPSGTGAVMYAAEKSNSGVRRWSGEMYGTDASRHVTTAPLNEESVRLPVFGVKSGEQTLFGIIEEGAESTVLNAETGNSNTGYSSIYPEIWFRGYDIYPSNSEAFRYQDISLQSSVMSKKAVTVGYYPLSGEDADYNGMAKRYRKYLQDCGLIADTKIEQSPYSVTLLGGVLTTTSLFGIPHKTLNSMTTFTQAKDIIGELEGLTGTTPSVRLEGFGNCGISPGKPAGGFGFPSVFGKEKQRLALEQYCTDKKISLFTDFDLIQCASSGGGFSYRTDMAESASGGAVSIAPLTTPLLKENNSMAYRLLKRENISKAVDKLIKLADKSKISGVSLSTLTDIAYSDYSGSDYAVKSNMERDVRKTIEKVRAAGHPVSASGTNMYAAATADVIFDVTIENGNLDVFDVQIPFYQMVFKGLKPMYCSSVNLASDSKRTIMLAATGGVGIGFTLIHDFDVSYMETGSEKLYGAKFENNRELIRETVSDYTNFINAVSKSGIERYEVLPNGVSKTVFDNNVVLYANHTSVAVESPVGVLEGYEYKVD